MKRFTAFFAVLLIIAGQVRSDDSPPDNARLWEAYGETGRIAYMTGFRDGGNYATVVLYQQSSPLTAEGHLVPPTQLYKTVSATTATKHNGVKLVEVMTDLYKNPANSFVDLADMVYIARDVLSGEHVDERLRAARKKAIYTHEINMRMKNAGKTP